MRELSPIEEYYGKFNEDKRLKSRHGQVEYILSMKYIHIALEECQAKRGCDRGDIRILDLGAATGAYSVPLAEEGYDVTAVELVKHNLSRLKVKSNRVHAILGDARDLHKHLDDYYDLILNFGPMYHLFTHEDKLQVLREAKRVLKPDGTMLVAYCMNEYGVVMYAIGEGHLKELKDEGRLDEDYHTISHEKNLYDYVRLEDIDRLNLDCGLKRRKIITPDGPTNYIRPYLKTMSEDEFRIYVEYVESIAERGDIIGASAHTVDILNK